MQIRVRDKKGYEATVALRILKRTKESSNGVIVAYDVQRVLQQFWSSPNGRGEWRDVPLEIEQEEKARDVKSYDAR